MQRFVHAFVSLYWCAAFAMLALSPGTFLGEGFVVPLRDFETGIAVTPLASVAGIAALLSASAAVLIAALFLWTVLSASFDDFDDMRSIAALAFAGGGLLTVLLLGAAMASENGTVSALWIALQALALLASWLALGSRRTTRIAERAIGTDGAPKTLARDAARELMATRLSRRMIEPREEIG